MPICTEDTSRGDTLAQIRPYTKAKPTRCHARRPRMVLQRNEGQPLSARPTTKGFGLPPTSYARPPRRFTEAIACGPPARSAVAGTHFSEGAANVHILRVAAFRQQAFCKTRSKECTPCKIAGAHSLGIRLQNACWQPKAAKRMYTFWMPARVTVRPRPFRVVGWRGHPPPPPRIPRVPATAGLLRTANRERRPAAVFSSGK